MTNARDELWAVTAYFNLTGSVRRRANFDCFRRHLSVPLLAIEWNPDGMFELNREDADIVLQVSGGDLMWQKERLLNLAAQSLPDHAKHVAWMDCDVLFTNPGWADAANEALARHEVIQLYSAVAFPDEADSARLRAAPGPHIDGAGLVDLPCRPSFVSIYKEIGADVARYDLGQRTLAPALSNGDILLRPAHGYAWAARASFLRACGLYDRCIIGSGDMHFCYGVSGLAQHYIKSQSDIGLAFYGDCLSYRSWAAKAAQRCSGALGCLDERIVHLFHGELQDRQYRARIDNLLPFALDLDQDIWARDGEPWVWKRDRSALNTYFLDYMRARKEDGQIAGA